MTIPRMRSGDAERQAAVDRLTEHFTAGRLSPVEYDDRVRQAYASTFLDELTPLFDDLPEQRGRDSFRSAQEGTSAGAGASAGAGPAWGAGRHGWNSGVWAPGRPGGRVPTGRRHVGLPRIVLLSAAVAVVLLLVVSAAHLIFPLVWIGLAVMFFSRRGHCGRGRYGPRSAP